MKNRLQEVALRKNAIYIGPRENCNNADFAMNESTAELVANSYKLGYAFSETLLRRVNAVTPVEKLLIINALKELKGVNKNWTPLVKQWNHPTGESRIDHIITWIANLVKSEKGTRMPCGHLIPPHTFPLERYNGCPFCGTPFEFGELIYDMGKNKPTILNLWEDSDMKRYLEDLLQSPVALDATQMDDLRILLKAYPYPKEAGITIKETLMTVIDSLVDKGKIDLAGSLFDTPHDILRYLWYKHTGYLQLIEPKTINKRNCSNNRNIHPQLDESKVATARSMNTLELKYSRTESKIYAKWLNDLQMDVKAQCENMHPKRGMWVRMIRALRLSEYSKKKGYDKLALLMDTFYNQDYEVWQGKVNEQRLKSNAEAAFVLLKQRPGLFARSLFSSMLWFGPETAICHFKEVMHQVPKRLIYSLNMYAESYFVKNGNRVVSPLGGLKKVVPSNKLNTLYSDDSLKHMKSMVQGLTLELIKNNLSLAHNNNKTMYIDQGLYHIPLAIGDRSGHVQDMPHTLMGSRFQVEGDVVRLFMQWGHGLKAQHLDMDLSCYVAYDDNSAYCSYSQLVIPGCKHSGDIRSIPEKVGTAEYIDVDLSKLHKGGARYVIFTCNAYSNGSLSPNMVVGWMNSRYPMKISSKGVAYDPTAVQHQVRIVESLDKGMVFGVLDVAKNEIIWLEMPFGGQVVQNLKLNHVEVLLAKLDAKIKIGQILELKAEVQGLSIVDCPSKADEVYDMNWALDTSKVNQLLL